MSPEAPAPSRFRFGNCQLDLVRRELRLKGKVVPLQPRAFDLLALLVQRPGQALSKDVLIAAVWPTTHVTDAVLSMAAARIRKAIGDSGSTPMLATLHGVGYRFDAEVTSDVVEAPAPRSPALAAPNTATLGATQSDDHAFWQAQQEQVRALERAGNAAEALRLLELLPSSRPPNAERLLLTGRLLRKRQRLTEAQRCLEQGLDLDVDQRQKPLLLLEQAKVAMLRYDMAMARELVERIKEGVAEGAVDPRLLPDVLAFQSRLVYLTDGHVRLLAVAAQIEQLAQLPRDAQALATAAVARARALHSQAIHGEALAEAQRAARMAEAHGAHEEASDAYRFLAAIANQEGRLELSLAMARRALALTEACGDVYHWQSALTRLGLMLIFSARLDEVEGVLNRMEEASRPSESALSQFNLTLLRSLWQWRRGELQASTEEFAQLLDRFRQRNQPSVDAVIHNAERALGLGDCAPALAILEANEDLGTEMERSLLRAGVCLHQGDRDAAKRLLKRVSHSVHAARSVGSSRVALSLAWLQIEDGESPGLAALLEGLRPLRQEHPAAAWVLDVHEMRSQGRALSETALNQHAQRCCGLRNRHGWLLTPAGLADSLQGRRHLHELMHTAWF